MHSKRTQPGIEIRHGRGCPASFGSKCKCSPTYRPWVYSKAEGGKVRPPAPVRTLAEAKAWRAEASVALRKGTLRAPSALTVREAGKAFITGALDGSIRNRSGDTYKPSAIRGYEQALRTRIYPDFGAAKLSEVSRRDVQDLADRMLAAGCDPSTIRNALMPLRAIYRRALSRDEVTVNPTTGLQLPAVRGKRLRIAAPDEAARLIAALPDEADRALWATATYAGLRYGELAALRWEQVDLPAGLIRVERAWDPKAREYVEPKSRAGVRRVPIASGLREFLIAHRLRSGRSTGLVFSVRAGSPFDSWAATERARKAWKAAGLSRLGLHEARHTFASLMIAAGVNAKALSMYMGHSSITITIDRYGHLMPGNEEEAAGLLDAYLAGASAQR